MAPALKPGFADPPADAARCFRILLDAMSRPGLVQKIATDLPAAGRLNPASVMTALTLCDHESPVWLDDTAGDEAIDYIRFHCGAPITRDTSQAAFAFFAGWPDQSVLAGFSIGSPDYPDASATLVIQVDGMSNSEDGVALAGPGIESVHRLAVTGLPDEFWTWLQASDRTFPLGIDIILAGPDCLAALPRTVRVMEAAGCM